ncbi:MAG TPA: FimV/HubP family polar landmark protein [Burkholderiales bacterium]|nr:FimV/HubP family polar landmark protein [Burkholderiales bacterium]
MGKLSVLSALGQPLKAEIEIVSLQRGEGDSLAARLAPGDAFRQANIELNPALLSVKFAVERRSGGQYVMALTSGQPINEPFLDILVELNWASGRLVREYTFLLDPPEYAALRKPEPIQSVQPPQVEPPMPLTPPQADFPPGPILSAQTTPAGPTATASDAPREPAATAQAAAVGSPAPAVIAESAPTPVQALPAETRPAGPVQVQVEPVSANPSPVALVEEPGVSRTYEVKRGDTLTKIAVRNRIEGVALQQMLVALFRANQEAFVADNMNRLRAGKIISIPDRDAASAVALADSRRIVSAQVADFNDYRRSLGIAVASAPAAPEGGRQVSGQISAPKEEKPVPSKEPSKDQLRLSRADDAKRGAKAAGTAAADDVAAKENALKEAKERITLLEKNVQDLQKLAQIRSQTGTQLQQQAQAAKSAPPESSAKAAQPGPSAKAAPVTKAPEPAAKAVPVTKAAEPAAKAAPAAKADAPKPAEIAKADASKATAQPAKAPEAAKAPTAAKAPEPAKAPESTARAPEPAKPDATKAVPKALAKAAPPPPPQTEANFVDGLLDSSLARVNELLDNPLVNELLDNPLALGGAGGAVILLAGYAAYAWRRKRSSQFENSIMSVVPSDANSVLGTEGGRSVDTGSSSFQSDFSQVGKLDTEEIDPIAEADVYMAYGRDAQAEEILKDALAKDSGRQAVRVKLLEIYANRKDARAFESAANELHSATGGRGAEWEKVAALGLSIDPTNALYGGKPQSTTQSFMDTAQVPAFGGPAVTEPALEPLNIDFDIGGASGSGAQLPDINLDAGAATGSGPQVPDINLDAPSAESAPAGLDFDLGLGGDKPAGGTTTAATTRTAAAPAAEPALSIDFDLPGDKPAEAPAAAPPAVPAADLGAIDFDLGTAGGEAKTETAKAPPLDLASISLDLGTPGGGNGSGGGPDARWQEVATKLDLAKAYEEMGDKDGARELLKEVVKEGDAAQQQQAQTMLQTLG